MKSSDKILTFTAIFISCLALTVSIVQTRIMQKQSQAAVWPRLGNGQGFGEDYFKFTVSNEGVGPAIISNVDLNYKGASFQNTVELIKHFGELEAKEKGHNSIALNYDYSTIYPGQVLGAGETINLFYSKDSIAIAIGKKYISNTNITIDYCSIYDVCWKMENDKVYNASR